MLYETEFLLALVTTCCIEIPVLLGLLRFLFRDNDTPVGKVLFCGLLCNALSLPYIWFVLPPYVDAAYYPLIGETIVVIVEAVVLNRVLGLSPKRAAVCSLVMNTASFALGWFLL